MLPKLRERRPFDFQEVNIYKCGQERWRMLYKYDIPVLHVQPATEDSPDPDLAAEAKKLMHRFSEKEVEELMDQVEKET